LNDLVIPEEVSDLIKIDKKLMDKINSRLPEFNRAKSMIGHSTSQTSYSLQTMNMIDSAPLSRMKQCLSQIRKKYEALQEAYFKIEKVKLEIKKLGKKKQTELTDVLIREKVSQIENISFSMSNAVRQLGMFQNMYDSIKKNHNIPDDWTEADYEKQEIENMIKSAFRLGIQELTAMGRFTNPCVEWCEQLGIHPQIAEQRIRDYMQATNDKMNNGEKVTVKDMYYFLDSMVEEFGEEWKHAIKRIGLDEIGATEFMAEGQTRPT
jgi:hypothetical protein